MKLCREARGGWLDRKLHTAEKRSKNKNASQSRSEVSFILSSSGEEEGGSEGSWEGVCSCLAGFQPADGLIAELRAAREAAAPPGSLSAATTAVIHLSIDTEQSFKLSDQSLSVRIPNERSELKRPDHDDDDDDSTSVTASAGCLGTNT